MTTTTTTTTTEPFVAPAHAFVLVRGGRKHIRALDGGGRPVLSY